MADEDFVFNFSNLAFLIETNLYITIAHVGTLVQLHCVVMEPV